MSAEPDPFAPLPCPVCAANPANDCPRCQGTRLSPVMWILGKEHFDKINAAFDEGKTPEIERPTMRISALVPDGKVVILPLPITLAELLWQGTRNQFQVKPPKDAPLYY